MLQVSYFFLATSDKSALIEIEKRDGAQAVSLIWNSGNNLNFLSAHGPDKMHIHSDEPLNTSGSRRSEHQTSVFEA